jgi:hypothetical protein
LTPVEPNDTPAQATPLGTSMAQNIFTWVNGNPIGGNNTADYFVFKTGPMAGQFQLGSAGFCTLAALTTFSATLWKVVAGAMVMPPIHSWTASGTCITSAVGDAPLEANTVYLLGVFGTGSPTMYTA